MTKKPTASYPEVDNNAQFPAVEQGVLDYWKKDGTFRKSVDNVSGDEEFIFYDGPPFANGLPHYGHLLTSCVKDIFARYQTMQGKKTERRFGWDCHGLPAEMEAEKELGVSGRKAIENYGIAKFNDHCRTSVMKYTDIWQDYVNRAARWVDFENDYKTMDTNYMESVLWAFKTLFDKGLVYESYRVMPYSWAAETPLSNFETKMDDAYREKTDKACYVAFKLNDLPPELDGSYENCYLVAWTTTPWTLPSNLALAVGKNMEYVKVVPAIVGQPSNCYIVAKSALGALQKEIDQSNTIPVPVDAETLIGLTYEPLFPYFKDHPNAFRVIEGDFIEEGSGTGIVHLAPGFGEDDMRVCVEAGIEVVCPVDESGRYTDELFDLKYQTKDGQDVELVLRGLNVIEELEPQTEFEKSREKRIAAIGLSNFRIINYLKEQDQLIKEEDYKHNYPHCWRTDKPIIYKALSSWYVEVTKFKDRMVELNQNINWIPEHIKDGQFGKWLENARDWSISRNRFWGTPIPIWRNEEGETRVFGSIKELEEFFGVEVKDLHRPFIDELKTAKDGSKWERVSDVFDCWFESGSMPFAQVHYPFENKDWFEEHFPADFIVEYVGQTRGWFYTLMVLGTALFDKEPFKNCICHGIILAEDGKKLSKRLKNYPDPNEMFDLYGADAMRWRMVSEPIMLGGNLLISKDGSDIRDVVRLSIKPIWNAYYFFCLYANADGIEAKEVFSAEKPFDRYILLKLKEALGAIEESLDAYNTVEACKAVDRFFDALNNWYIRRNRDRVWSSAADADPADKQAVYDVLYTCLTNMAKAASPLLPLVSESVWQGLTGGETSVHLQAYPKPALFDGIDEEVELGYTEKLIPVMDRIRDVCNTALSIRSEENIRVRQPLAKLTYFSLGDRDRIQLNQEYLAKADNLFNLIKDEVNVDSIDFKSGDASVSETHLKVNPPVLGKRLPHKMKEIIPASKKGDWKELDDGRVEICGEVLEGEECTIEVTPKDPKGAQAISDKQGIVVLDLSITPELEARGLARDVVRLVQQARKEADLQITDRILVGIKTEDALWQAIEANKNDIAKETLANEIINGQVENPKLQKDEKLNDAIINISLKPAA